MKFANGGARRGAETVIRCFCASRHERKSKILEAGYQLTIQDLIRRRIDKLIKETPVDMAERRRRALSIVGRYRSGLRELSIEHDEYLDIYVK